MREKRGEKEAEGHRVTGKDESEREIGETRGNVKETTGSALFSSFLSVS